MKLPFTGLLLIVLIGSIISNVQGFYARNREKDNRKWKNDYQMVKLRRMRSHEPSPEELLRGAKTDADVATSMGAMNLASSSDRKRRDQAEIHVHETKAEGDAIAAAAESAAAEADAVAAAVEVAEAEQMEEQEGGHSHGGHGQDHDARDNSITFEENEDGDNMVVVEEDLREKEHGAGGHHDSSLSEFDMSSDSTHGESDSHHAHDESDSHHAHDDSDNHHAHDETESHHVHDEPTNNHAHVVSGSDAGNGVGLGSVHEDIETPLNKLLSESSDLAKEIRLVFQVLARREDYLVQEMELLKTALQNAIQVLHDANKESGLRAGRHRRDFDQNPYKACVYINPPDRQIQAQGQDTANFAPPEALVQEPAQAEASSEAITDVSRSATSSASAAGGDDIDLSSVFWLKLPENDEQGVLEKVHQVLSGVRSAGRDVLLIPVTKQFASNEDVAKGFLKAVRVNPASQQSRAKKFRKRLRLRVKKV